MRTLSFAVVHEGYARVELAGLETRRAYAVCSVCYSEAVMGGDLPRYRHKLQLTQHLEIRDDIMILYK